MISVPEKRGDARRETGDYMIACSVSSLAAGITIKPIGQGRHLPSHLYPLTAFDWARGLPQAQRESTHRMHTLFCPDSHSRKSI